ENNQTDFVLAVVDMSSMERGLFLVTQVMDLGIPMAVILNMEDMAEEQGLIIKTHQLYKSLGIAIIQTNARSNKGLQSIEGLIGQRLFETPKAFLNPDEILPEDLAQIICKEFNLNNPYQAFQLIRFQENDSILT